MKYDLAIAIRVGSPNSTFHLVRETFESLSKNIGRCKYKFLISIDPSVKDTVKNYLYQLNKKDSLKYQILHEKRVYWAEFINEAISNSRDAQYFIKAHDDIKLLTPNFFSKVKRIIATLREPIGWISFTESNYLYRDYYYGPSTRPGWHSDFYEGEYSARKMFQFHFLPDRWWQGNALMDGISAKLGLLPRKTSSEVLSRIDLPSGPVKCHAPYNMFVMIETRTLKKIGTCENWQTYNALLVDEDWGLRAMQLKHWNIWIPSIEYLHLRPPGLRYGNRSQYQVQNDAKRVHRLFIKKWGFDNPCPQKKLPLIKKRYSGTNITWSIGRLSHDWDYVKSRNAPIRLHLGCGNRHLPGFINIDIKRSAAVDKVMDVRKLDYPNGSVDQIYTAHVLEHFPHGEVPSVLKHWYQILKRGGLLIVVVPNLDLWINWYLTHNRQLTHHLNADFTGGALFPEKSYRFEDYHKTFFNSESFRKLAKQSGFHKVREIDLKNGKFPITIVDKSMLHYSSMAFILTK